jgi:hypothetical protein
MWQLVVVNKDCNRLHDPNEQKTVHLNHCVKKTLLQEFFYSGCIIMFSNCYILNNLLSSRENVETRNFRKVII